MRVQRSGDDHTIQLFLVQHFPVIFIPAGLVFHPGEGPFQMGWVIVAQGHNFCFRNILKVEEQQTATGTDADHPEAGFAPGWCAFSGISTDPGERS